jgi:restriction system protein
MLPFLQTLDDGKEHTISDLIESIANRLHLTSKDRTELLDSGKRTRLSDRVWWVRTHFLKAGLLESTGRGRVRITQRGHQILKTNPTRVDMRVLKQFPEYVEFRSGKKSDNEVPEREETSELSETRTPQEIIETNHRALREALAQDLLEKVKSCSPEFFEKLVVDLLLAMGYGGSRKDAGKAIGSSREIGGIDGVIKQDQLGLDVVYLQAKRWDNPVGLAIVSGFGGSLDPVKARKGVLITTSRFTEDAIGYVKDTDKRIVLIDGETLANLMIEHGVGVELEATYDIKRLDPDYFEEV